MSRQGVLLPSRLADVCVRSDMAGKSLARLCVQQRSVPSCFACKTDRAFCRRCRQQFTVFAGPQPDVCAPCLPRSFDKTAGQSNRDLQSPVPACHFWADHKYKLLYVRAVSWMHCVLPASFQAGTDRKRNACALLLHAAQQASAVTLLHSPLPIPNTVNFAVPQVRNFKTAGTSISLTLGQKELPMYCRSALGCGVPNRCSLGPACAMRARRAVAALLPLQASAHPHLPSRLSCPANATSLRPRHVSQRVARLVRQEVRGQAGVPGERDRPRQTAPAVPAVHRWAGWLLLVRLQLFCAWERGRTLVCSFTV